MLDAELLLQLQEKEIDVDKRILYLYDAITPFTPMSFQLHLELILKLSSEDKKDDPITLQIGSPGGDVLAYFGILGLMSRYQSLQFNAEVCGLASSAAALLFITTPGTRIIHKNAFLLLHPITTIFESSLSLENLVENTKISKILDGKIYKLLAEHSNKPAAFWKTLIKKDIFLDAETCIKYGIADTIV
jgi:ATP-dependent protease ClpP protease subunit